MELYEEKDEAQEEIETEETEEAVSEDDNSLDNSSEDETQEESTEETDEQLDSEYSEGFSKKVEGKSREEIIRMLSETEKFAGKQSQEKGELKKLLEKSTKDDITSIIKSKKDNISKLEKRLEETDFLDDQQEFRELTSKITKEKENLIREEMKHHVAYELRKKDNLNLVNNMVKEYQANQIPLSNEEVTSLYEKATLISSDGDLDPEHVEAALMLIKGKDKYTKYLKLVGEDQARDKISKAGKRRTDFQIGGKGSKGGEVDLSKMDHTERQNYVRNLSKEQLNKKWDNVKKKYNG